MTDTAPKSGEWLVCVDFGTALSKAAAAPANARSPAQARPLRVGRLAGAANPYLVPSALLVGEERLFFGPNAIAQADATVRSNQPILSFKATLGADDLEAALSLRTSRVRDPRGLFTLRDHLVLYIAWFLSLVREAAVDDVAGVAPPIQDVRLRYTVPGWTKTDPASARILIGRLFDEAMHVAGEAAGPLMDLAGLKLGDALELVEIGREAPEADEIEGSVLEAVAAATCHAMGQPRNAVFVVLDMGAGTTDIAAVRADARGVVTEIPQARQTLFTGGDALDQAVLNRILARAPLYSEAERGAVWREALPMARDLKEELWSEGVTALSISGKTVPVKLAELERESGYKDVRDALGEALNRSLATAAKAAETSNIPEIALVLAGGGARLKFVQELAKKARIPRVRIKVLPPTPDWAIGGDGPKGPFPSAFPQLAIAIGGAVAPPNLVARSSELGALAARA